MPVILPENHFTLLSGDEMDQICQPLKTLGITCFNYTKLCRDGSNLQLTNRPLFLKDFYAEGLYRQGRFEHTDEKRGSGYVLSSMLDEAAQKVFTFARNYHDIDHVITITKKGKSDVEFYHFGGPRQMITLPNFYLNNIDLLERFIVYFHEKAHSLVHEAHKHRIYHSKDGALSTEDNLLAMKQLCLLDKHSTVRQQFLEQLQLKNYHLIHHDQKVAVSKREVDCLRELLKGLTAEEIGRKLFISRRTVETHFSHVKDKLQCSTKSQLIGKLRQNYFDLFMQGA